MQFYKINKLSLLFFLWIHLAFSQNFPSKNYNATNDLPNNTVRSLLVDSNSTLWVGTDNGVVKKENDVFSYFFEEDGLALNSCWAIAEDKNKNIWFGSYGEGLSIYDGSKFKVISTKDGLVHNEITKLFTHKNYLYVGTSNGISIINVDTYKVISLKASNKDELYRVQDFFEYKNEIYVATYNSGIFKIENTSLIKINDEKYIYSILLEKDSIYSSNKGFFTKTSLKYYLDHAHHEINNKLGSSIIWDYAKTKDAKIFAAAWGIYNSSGGIYEIINNQLISRASDFNIASNEVISLAYNAKFEKLYVGTKDAGLFEIKLNSQIQFHKIQDKSVLGFARTSTTSALMVNDGIILKSEQQEKKITLTTLKAWQENYALNTKIPLPKHEDLFYELEYNLAISEIDFYDIKALNNKFWINTNLGIFAITTDGKLDRYLPLHSEEINFTNDGKLIETNPYGGVRVYNNLDKFEYKRYEQEDPETPTMVVNSLKIGDKTYFTSVFSGLYVWQNNKFLSYLKNGIWKEKKLRHIINFGENLAISNEFGDVFLVNVRNQFKILKKIPRAKINGNTISFLNEYKGSLIIGTEKGLTIYKAGRYIFLDEEQGLKQPLLCAEVRKNHLIIGSDNGYFNINLQAINDTKALVDHIKLKEVYINNHKILWKTFVKENQIELPYNENTVLLKFSTNAHPYPHKLSYQYRLNSKEKWSLPSSKPEIFLAFLPAKNYKIAVKVLDKSTGLYYTQHLINLDILPPFWKRWWFVYLFLIITFLVIYSIYKFQIRQHEKFQEQKTLIQKRFEETKMEALLAQMNPHFIFNAMNSIQNYIMDSDVDNATIFLGDFSKLIRLNLDHCTKPTLLLIEEIEYLQSYIRVENTRFNNKIAIDFNVDPALDVYDVGIPTMILQTFVENVFVHAFPPSITNPTLKIDFKLLSENELQCTIEDNGIGFKSKATNKLHQSKGIILVKERLSLLGYNVEEAVTTSSIQNHGTIVIIKLKL